MGERLITPRAEIDRARLEKNCLRMRDVAARHGVRLRPHAKTAKSTQVVDVALSGASFRGITVSTLDEAQYFAERGFRDLLYAVGLVPHKISALERIAATGVRVGVITDDPGVAQVLLERDPALEVWAEIDCGNRRGGLDPSSPGLVELARIVASGQRLSFGGVLTHAGQSYRCRNPSEVAEVAETERAAAVLAATRIRETGIACPGVSVGSTPTALAARSLEGVTEIRPGVYMFFDLFQAAIGSCARDDLALSVVASVISRADDHFWIDAGALALSQDRSLDAVGGSGFGEVTLLDGGELDGAARVVEVHQEHGRVAWTQPSMGSRGPEVGDFVRVWPNHACLTAAMFDTYWVRDSGAATNPWPRLRG